MLNAWCTLIRCKYISPTQRFAKLTEVCPSQVERRIASSWGGFVVATTIRLDESPMVIVTAMIGIRLNQLRSAHVQMPFKVVVTAVDGRCMPSDFLTLRRSRDCRCGVLIARLDIALSSNGHGRGTRIVPEKHATFTEVQQ
jgi:RNA polymerase subunit RPABC4/transcription elongation factor Spt4